MSALIIIVLGYLYFTKDKKCNISEIDVIRLNNFFNPSLVGNEKYWCKIKTINFKLGVNGEKIIPEIGKLSNLENLILNDKKLSGEIPNELLKQLDRLSIKNTNLTIDTNVSKKNKILK